MSAKNPDIGYCRCPVCDFPDAPVREQAASKRAYIVCDECGTQIFTRWTQGNRAVRAKMRPVQASAAPASSKAADADDLVLGPQQPKKEKAAEEKTIFDLLL